MSCRQCTLLQICAAGRLQKWHGCGEHYRAMSRSPAPASDPLLDFYSEEEVPAADLAKRWRKVRGRRLPAWVSAVRSELAGLPATEALTGTAIVAAIAFVSAFALTTKATPKAAIAIEAHEIN